MFINCVLLKLFESLRYQRKDLYIPCVSITQMINTDAIKTAIIDREEELQQKFKQENIIEREIAKAIKIRTDSALIITGVRRCGKSVLAYMLSKGQKCVYINFEDERLNIEAKDLNLVLEAVYSLKGAIDLLIFDEIQNIAGWERFVAR